MKIKLFLLLYLLLGFRLLFAQNIGASHYETLPKELLSKYAIIYEKNNLSGAMTLDGIMILEPIFKYLSGMDSLGGFEIAQKYPTQYGISNGKGETIVPVEYQDIRETKYFDRFVVEKNNKKGL